MFCGGVAFISAFILGSIVHLFIPSIFDMGTVIGCSLGTGLGSGLGNGLFLYVYRKED